MALAVISKRGFQIHLQLMLTLSALAVLVDLAVELMVAPVVLELLLSKKFIKRFYG